jgi:Fis family transcriptional regulator
VERPLLEIVMKHVKSNQCKAAEMLGINRNTLRKKLKLHGLDK